MAEEIAKLKAREGGVNPSPKVRSFRCLDLVLIGPLIAAKLGQLVSTPCRDRCAVGTSMTNAQRLAVILAVLGLSGCATAPVPESENLSMAREVVSLTFKLENLRATIDNSRSATRSVVDIAKTFCNPPRISMPVEECLQRYHALEEAEASETGDLIQSIWPAMVEDRVSLMARTYSGKELAAMRDFYSSPVGLSITTRQVQFDAEWQRAMAARLAPQL